MAIAESARCRGVSRNGREKARSHVNKLAGWKARVLVALVAVAAVLAVAGPGDAQALRGRDGAVKRPSAAEEHRPYDGLHRDWDREHRDTGSHRGFDHGRRQYRGAPLGYWGYPYYVYRYTYPYYYAPPEYRYYCPIYEDFYPNLESCPEPWLLIPAS